MRTGTFIIAAAALRVGGLRAAARMQGLPLASVAAALDRLESRLGLPLARRTDAGLALTVEAQRHAGAIDDIAALCARIHGQPRPARSVGFTALFRLAAVLRGGSIRGAATQLGLAQPHLTRQVAQTEAALDRALLIRRRDGVTVTDQGVALLSQIERLQTLWEALTHAARRAAPPQSQRYALGTVIPGTPGGDLAGMIGRIARDVALRQGEQLAITASPAEELLAGLDAGRFDAVIVDTRAADPGYRQHLLSQGRLAMVGRDMPQDLHDRAGLRLALAAQPLALQTRHSGLRQRAEDFLDHHAGADWRGLTRVIEVDSLPVIVRLVRDGDVSSVLPVHPSLHLPDTMQLTLPPDYDQSMWLTWRRRPKAENLATRIIGVSARQ